MREARFNVGRLMRLRIVAVGRMKRGPELDLVNRYVVRADGLGRSMSLGPVTTHEIAESRAGQAQQRKREEAAKIDDLIGEAHACIVLDERGELWDSPAFSERIRLTRDSGDDACAFVIGGSDGLDPQFRGRARHIVSFGRMTVPHQLVRVLLAEQIYRAMTILAGHPYHRA